jgi:N utilization substance protein B
LSTRSKSRVSPQRRERVLAFQALFMLDVGEVDLQTALDYAHSENLDLNLRDWLEKRVRGTWEGRQGYDNLIKSHLQNWSWERIGRVERNLMRLAVFEMLECADDLKFSAAISEAVDLAKEYGDEKSAPFVNGVLDACWREAKGEAG